MATIRTRRLLSQLRSVAGLRCMSSTTTAATRTSRIIELRSDTLTLPSEGMRRAMYLADVGDDCYNEDKTVARLENAVAELLGKEAGAFCASGTMSNLLAIATHCKRGDEIILGETNHIYCYEGGGASSLLGVAFHPIPVLDNGTNRVSDIVDAIRDDDIYFARSRLVAVENTHNKADGRPLPVDFMEEVGHACHQHNLSFHVDGARLLNASVAMRTPAAEIVRAADSVSLCMSKGLGAPIGSVLVGNRDFIKAAKRERKTVGGGWRQAGIMASAALYALEHHIPQLAIDHENAHRLAQGLSRIPGIYCDPSRLQTNLVYFFVMGTSPARLVEELKAHNILLGSGPYKGTKLRAVTSSRVTSDDIDITLEKIKEIMEREMGITTTTTPQTPHHEEEMPLAMASSSH